ncbi:MFS transporter [Methylobacterium sp. J-030]|uniref:MFS transporter n=1 Tax=Methylobacterium sp. J-030 TaxID=2836627 RepID=UPI001FBB7B1F|nr:MFS transporter [Methylobacterium sp. J-030]MCJ2074040.1 MFS transporter [Methylobacterium sp. J-030]
MTTVKLRWRMVSLLFVGGLINYIDRAALSVAAPQVAADLHLSPGQMGIVFSGFFVGYALFNFIGGWAADRFGAKRVMSVAMAAWSMFCGLTALTGSFVSLFLVRTMFGMAEGPLATTINKMVNNWFPHRQVATALGLANCGLPLGGAISGPLIGLLLAYLGWRASFAFVPLLGLTWLVFWMLGTTDKPRQHPHISATELQDIESNRPVPVGEDQRAEGLGYYLRQPAIVAAMISYFGYSYILFFFLTWFPSYLTIERGLSLKSMSLATTLPWLVGFIGYGASGWLSDRVFDRTGNALTARKWVLIGCLGTSALFIALAGLVTTTASALLLVSGAVLALYLSGSTYWAIIQDVVPSAKVGSVGGLVHAVANCAGIFGPTITGYLVEGTGSFSSAFFLAGGVALLGVGAVLLLIRPIPLPGPSPRTVVAR